MADAKHWFHSKSPEAKKAYIAAHPTSIYAKQAKHARGDAQRARSIDAQKAAHAKRVKAAKDAREKRLAAQNPSDQPAAEAVVHRLQANIQKLRNTLARAKSATAKKQTQIKLEDHLAQLKKAKKNLIRVMNGGKHRE